MKVIAMLDDSAAGRAVIDVAVALAARVAADVVAVHVREAESPGAPELLRRTAAERGVPMSVVDGHVVPAIIELLAAADVAYGVMGSRSQPGGKRPAGRTAIAVASAAARPIVVTPPSASVADIRRLLVPLEGTPEGAAALGEVVARLAAAGVDVVPLHVFTPATVPSFWDQAHHAAPAWSAGFLSRFGPATADNLWLRSGDVAEAVLDLIAAASIDLVALAWSQNLTGGHAPVVRALLSRSPVPVLLVPAGPPP
jgi:hypothetical protein